MAAGPPGKTEMFVAILKLIDVAARAGFMIFATFALPLAVAGQFGILLTLTALFAFAFGWERSIDVQRRFVGGGEVEFDVAVRRALHLFAFNYAILLPIYALLVAVWANVHGSFFLGPVILGLAWLEDVHDRVGSRHRLLAIAVVSGLLETGTGVE